MKQWEFHTRAKVHPHRFASTSSWSHEFANVTTSVEFRQNKVSSKGNVAVCLVLVGSRGVSVQQCPLWGLTETETANLYNGSRIASDAPQVGRYRMNGSTNLKTYGLILYLSETKCCYRLHASLMYYSCHLVR